PQKIRDPPHRRFQYSRGFNDGGGAMASLESRGAGGKYRLAICLLSAACTGDGAVSQGQTGEAQVYVRAPAATQPDQQCLSLDLLRLSNFTHVTYQGVTNGATFNAFQGDFLANGFAYPQPCSSPPAAQDAPWVMDPVTVTFVRGRNNWNITMHPNVRVVVDTFFDDQTDPAVIVNEASRVRIGRNNEDIANRAGGPTRAIDAWDVTTITVPAPGSGSTTGTETSSFSTKVPAAGIPYSPRGMAALPSGKVVFQVGDTWQPLWVF